MTVSQFILERAGKGNGVATIGLYDNFSTREINKAIRILIDERKMK